MGICLSFLSRLPCPCNECNECEGFKTFKEGCILLITEGTVSPFARTIENALTKHYKKIVKLNLSASLDQYSNSSAIVIRDVPYRQLESDSNRLKHLETKLKNLLIFHIVPDEYSQLTVISSEHFQEATLHRTHGNCVSARDEITIQKNIRKFVSKAQAKE
jgi:hypothetical protein